MLAKSYSLALSTIFMSVQLSATCIILVMHTIDYLLRLQLSADLQFEKMR